jgi:hypothetical protein
MRLAKWLLHRITNDYQRSLVLYLGDVCDVGDNEIFGDEMNKALSGRWIFTVVCAAVFLYCAVYKILAPVDIKEIIMLVLVFYFQKGKDSPEEETK